jgi:hypothetical protein
MFVVSDRELNTTVPCNITRKENSMFSNIAEASHPVVVSIGYFVKVDETDDRLNNPFSAEGKRYVEKKFIADVNEISYRKIWPQLSAAEGSSSSLNIGEAAKDFGLPDAILMKIEDLEGRSLILGDERYVKEPNKNHQALLNSEGTSPSSNVVAASLDDEVDPLPDGSCPPGYVPRRTASGGIRCVRVS